MGGISVSLSVTVLTLAVVSAVAVWRVLNRDRDLHRQALALRRRLVEDLGSHHVKITQMRRRALSIAAHDGRATDNGRTALTGGWNKELASMDVVRGELARASMGLEQAHGRKLQELYRKLEAVGAKVAELGWDLEKREALEGAEAARPDSTPTAHPVSRRYVQCVA